jgi:trigger factor
MHISRETLNPCTVKLSIVCEPNEVTEGFESAFRHLTKKVRLPGFRPGKAPRRLLEPYIGAEEWNEQAAEEMIRKVYPKAVDVEKLEIDRTTLPHITVTEIDKAQGKFEFSVKVPLPPKVELGDYKGLPLHQPAVEVSDAEIDYELDELRQRGQTHAVVTDRGVVDGDIAVLNIKPDGEDVEGKTLVTIAGQNFPALDEAILGMKVEDMTHVELDFPEDFQQKEFAGKSLKAMVTLNSLSGVSLPTVDDAFAHSLKTENVEDLRNRLREAIGGAKRQMVRQLVHERLVDQLMQRSQVAVSDNMWENLANRRLEEFGQEQAEKGKTLADYAKEHGMSLEEFTLAWQGKAKLEVERALLIQTVYSKESMQVDNQDLNRELKEMSAEYELEPLELVETLKKNNALEELHFRALTRKVGDFLLSNADVTIGDEPEVETPSLEATATESEAPVAPVEEAPKVTKPRKRAAAPKPEA